MLVDELVPGIINNGIGSALGCSCDHETLKGRLGKCLLRKYCKNNQDGGGT